MNQDTQGRLFSLLNEAWELSLSRWPGTSSAPHLAVQTKDDGSLVSEADIAVHTLLVNSLRRLFPEDTIVSEEDPTTFTQALDSGRVWVLDPIDGTTSFINGRDDFSILVALLVNGRPQWGAMFFPALDLRVHASLGQGAWCNGARLRVAADTSLCDNSVYQRYLDPSVVTDEMIPPGMDSGMAQYKIALGELLGAIIKIKTHRAWDLVAPHLVIEEAGGTYSDEGGEKLLFQSVDMKARYIVASNGATHSALLKVAEEDMGQLS